MLEFIQWINAIKVLTFPIIKDQKKRKGELFKNGE